MSLRVRKSSGKVPLCRTCGRCQEWSCRLSFELSHAELLQCGRTHLVNMSWITRRHTQLYQGQEKVEAVCQCSDLCISGNVSFTVQFIFSLDPADLGSFHQLECVGLMWKILFYTHWLACITVFTF